ncbi:hypothetical protein MVEN_00952300 [Mycena venus]|uniref:Uncharacterized protein n=1 Tax=Mycena venus TaxID=2733690 RepID=A0A8H6YDA0_9AGAR|nr:hypothetical protein MVEN_00952300 [Mycena venus]
MGALWAKIFNPEPGDPCDKPLDPPNWPTDVPSNVSKFWSETECPALTSMISPLPQATPPPPPQATITTITVPQDVNEWWTSTGSAFFATKYHGISLPIIVPDSVPQQTPSSSTTNTFNQSQGMTMTTSSTEDISSAGGSGTSSLLPSSAITAAVSSSSSVPATDSVLGSHTEASPPPLSSTPTVSSSRPIAAKSNNKTTPIVVGVVIPLVLIVLGVVAFILYKRRQRARDRREWERTHEAIADAVRQVGAPAAVGLPAWNPARGDVKEPLDGDAAPLFEESGGSLPGSLGHSGTELLSHSRAPSSLI